MTIKDEALADYLIIKDASSCAQFTFICTFIFFFASTFGPGMFSNKSASRMLDH